MSSSEEESSMNIIIKFTSCLQRNNTYNLYNKSELNIISKLYSPTYILNIFKK